MAGYKIKEIYYTLQGEGHHTGRAAIFVRFSGCNLWSGREMDRHKAICKFCDTDFWGTDGHLGGTYVSAGKLAETIISLWPEHDITTRPYIVCTGGEPLLQLDDHLINTLHDLGCDVAIETNGTVLAPANIDWICMSPKANTKIVLNRGDELKIIYPQKGVNPEDYESLAFNYYYLQPMDGPDLAENTRLSLEYCMKHPQWKLSLQVHKILQIP
jgi:7-carboxy-7-deazaguanine synthase (Cx14CxxC type)